MNELKIERTLNKDEFAIAYIENAYNMSEKEADSLAFTVIGCMKDNLINLPNLYNGFSESDLKSEFKKLCCEAEGPARFTFND